MKKAITLILSLVLLLSCFAGCGSEDNTSFTITVEGATGGTLVSDKESVNIGESVTFTLTADSGNVVEKFTVNGGKVQPSATEDYGKYTYTLKNVLMDVTVSASFVNPNGTVIFNADGGACESESKSVILNGYYGELPTPYAEGKRFIGWFDDTDTLVVATSKVLQGGTITLKAKWDDLTEAEKQGLEPYSITTTYYDSSATQYGVVFHTENTPVAPVIQVVEAVEGASVDFSSASVYVCSYEQFLSHYISTGVLSGLKFSTSYAVRVGDISADRWSKTYYFTTREENPTKTNFLFITDTQEKYDFGSPYKDGTLLVDDNGDRIYQTYYQNVMKDATARFSDIDFIAHGGDMFDFAASEKHAREMLNSVQDYAFNIPTQLATGNHEYNDGGAGIDNVSVFYHYDSASLKTLLGDLYSFDYGYVHFVTLRSNDIYYKTDGYAYDLQLDQNQINWLKADLASVNREKTPWVVVMMHESFVSLRADEYGTKAGLAKQILPITTEYDVDLLLFGHDHTTISTNPIINDDSGSSYFGTKVKSTTTAVIPTEYDGVTVDKFDFTGVTGKRGTVYHQTACAGNQFSVNTTKYKIMSWNDRDNAKFVNGDNVNTSIPFIRSAYHANTGAFEGTKFAGKNYSTYSYVEATANQLVLRTYGVDVMNLAKSGLTNTTAYGAYFEGFMLNK